MVKGTIPFVISSKNIATFLQPRFGGGWVSLLDSDNRVPGKTGRDGRERRGEWGR
jgi:hypothetical protein